MVHVLRRLEGSGLLDEYPKLAAYIARAEARPTFKRASTLNGRFSSLHRMADKGPFRLQADVARANCRASAMGQHFAFCLAGCHGRNPSDSCRNYPRVATHPPCPTAAVSNRSKAAFIR
jgi:hypothetical protein